MKSGFSVDVEAYFFYTCKMKGLFVLKSLVLIATIFVFTGFSRPIYAAAIDIPSKRYSLGLGAQFGRSLYIDGDAPAADNYWEMNVLGKYYLSKKTLLRSGLGFEYRPFAENLVKPKSTLSFNGEIGFEFHFTRATVVADPYLFVGSGYPDILNGGAGIKLGGIQTVSFFLESNNSITLIGGLALTGRAGIMFHF